MDFTFTSATLFEDLQVTRYLSVCVDRNGGRPNRPWPGALRHRAPGHRGPALWPVLHGRRQSDPAQERVGRPPSR